jgi:hypothetical protein
VLNEEFLSGSIDPDLVRHWQVNARLAAETMIELRSAAYQLASRKTDLEAAKSPMTELAGLPSKLSVALEEH